jgi:hypothetical protein
MTNSSPIDLIKTPCVFDKLLEPVMGFVQEQHKRIPQHHNQKLDYTTFFRLLMCFFLILPDSLKLFITTKLNHGLLPKEFGFNRVPYSTFQEGFSRFSPDLFRDVFQHTLKTLSFKSVPDFSALGVLCCVDGSLFPVIQSMLWAEYTKDHQALKLHLCFELNRMIPVDFQVGHGNSSEREALLKMATAGVTYIADRGYMSFQLCKDLVYRQAFFIFRVKENLIYSLIETLEVSMPDSTISIFDSIRDEMICYENDKSKATYRLVRFTINKENYFILTNRRDLTTFQIIMLYAYRWQIELFFRFLKRSMGGIHLIRHDKHGTAIQFYTMMTLALLQLHLKQNIMDKFEGDENQSSEEIAVESDNGKGEGDIRDNKKSCALKKREDNSRLGDAGFLASLGGAVKKYWKIGIHWLEALRDLLAYPFDARTWLILQKSS